MALINSFWATQIKIFQRKGRKVKKKEEQKKGKQELSKSMHRGRFQ